MKTSQALVVLIAVGVSHCGKTASAPSPSEALAANSSDGSAAANPANADYPKLYCDNVGNLKLRSDVKQELDFFCRGGKPTKDFIDFRAEALAQAPGTYQLKLLQAQHETEGDRSEFLVAWSFRVPLRPFDVKSRPLYEYIAKNYSSDVIDLTAGSARRADTLDSELHLWSADLNYDLVIKGAQGLTLNSQRKTQYNLYQVQLGNEEMGFGVEHLNDPGNQSYSRSVMLNVSFNDGKGGAVIVTVLHFVLSNQGFPATATKSIQEIAQHAADSMYNGLKQ
ncbi:MAG TPA: hypothetical protein VE954_22760 [Oligoflexus sp.]|uniref:hypothetical protein n=1 Tax=Oligoflexus sp. TaxID=1971216 RepID=UPI002D2AFB37|nr:hypothetical protein [Oligoflexus sp.]HYX35932.1 hypothetical protein [Oligoflexus sp.]